MDKKPLRRVPVPQHPLPKVIKTVRSIDSTTETEIEEKEEEMALKKDSKLIYGIFALLILLGVGTGYLLSRGMIPFAKSAGTVSTSADANPVDGKKVVGVSDTQTFKDSATGVVEKGGLDGEGTHKLIRDGGPSQTVYLTSSIVDLDEFDGKKVTVWGQTMDAKKAAWLMDVGKVQLE